MTTRLFHGTSTSSCVWSTWKALPFPWVVNERRRIDLVLSTEGEALIRARFKPRHIVCLGPQKAVDGSKDNRVNPYPFSTRSTRRRG